MVDYSRVKAIIGEPDPASREHARSTLFDLGFRDISDTDSLIKLHRAVRRGAVDLIVINAAMNGDDTGFITRDIRAGKLGNDPFTIVIVLLAVTETARARSIADSGADDALLLPLTSEGLARKVIDLSAPRKPFVVTYDYIGPERRSAPRPDSPSATQIAVPNPLVSRGGAEAAAGYEAARDDARARLFHERVVRLGVQLEWLAEAVGATAAREESVLGLIHRLETAGKELAWRGGDADAIDRLLRQAKAMRTHHGQMVPPGAVEDLHAAATAVAATTRTPA